MQLKLDAASGSSLQAHGANTVTQQLHVTNSQHGIKSLALRLRINFTVNGASRLEQAEVKDLPLTV